MDWMTICNMKGVVVMKPQVPDCISFSSTERFSNFLVHCFVFFNSSYIVYFQSLCSLASVFSCNKTEKAVCIEEALIKPLHATSLAPDKISSQLGNVAFSCLSASYFCQELVEPKIKLKEDWTLVSYEHPSKYKPVFAGCVNMCKVGVR